MRRIPSSTYRLQLHKGFTFDDAAAIAQYLYDLGVSHVYSSPYLQAAPGSMHGYDVVDHQRVNQELGGREAHERFSKRLGENGLGQVLDIVPNHMSLGQENRFWWDVLENGLASRYASFFDIDWQPQEERLRDKVLVPILADQYGRVLQGGGIRVTRNVDVFHVEAAGQSLPVTPNSLPAILNRAAEYSRSDILSFLSASFGRLPVPDAADRRAVLARHRDKHVLWRLLKRLCADEPLVCESIDRAIAEINANLDALDDLLNQQYYRLAYWKTADQQLGYRRFFDVNTLIGLRMEREHVFEETHALLIDWLRRGVLDGVRVDHPDGLRDPLEYFHRLREHVPDGWIIGEKILEPGEYLRESWPIDGTSGYDFLNVASGVLVNQPGMAELTKVYGEFTDEPTHFPSIAHDKKINVMEQALGSDVNRLTSLFVEICECNRNQRDFTRIEIRRALREVASCFAIYRTYVVPDRDEITEEDRSYIERSIRCAKDNRAEADPTLFDFIRDVLTLQVRGRKESEFVLRFQQFTSPVMAKGVEDTAFYCYNRLIALNEVGADPAHDGTSIADFHTYHSTMHATHPMSMTTLSTHDTKRSDDVRARLVVLSEIPREFRQALRRWSRLNAKLRTDALPDRNTEYFYYQTLIGAWPITSERLHAYMQKATREAKQRTSWTSNNKEFEEALNRFIDATLTNAPFLADLEQMVARVRGAGRINSLAQTLIKHTAPGVPDLYQGSELWDLSLVDPDNRRPVDYDLRRSLLEQVKSLPLDKILERADDGLPKMWTIYHALHLRKQYPQWFGPEASYEPIEIEGRRREHALAYSRGGRVVTVVPRLNLLLNGAWHDTSFALPEGIWNNRLTGEELSGGTVRIDRLLQQFPVALLVRE
ncbi:MAG: malto-oligosyltrehalose synthase [Acidobacteriaceae bacterium]